MSKGLIVKLECLGQYGKPIFIHKFRSMISDADKLYEQVLIDCGTDNLGKILDDPRITSFGKFLREYFIDELPQIYNLFRGDISFVGIRPRSESRWNQLFSNYKARALNFKPGLFGVHYYYSDSRDIKDVIKSENEYLKRVEKGGKSKIDKEYFSKILENIVIKGLRSK